MHKQQREAAKGLSFVQLLHHSQSACTVAVVRNDLFVWFVRNGITKLAGVGVRCKIPKLVEETEHGLVMPVSSKPRVVGLSQLVG